MSVSRQTSRGLFLLFASCVVVTPMFAASFTATQSGNWNDVATWGGGGFPGAADSATINGFTVTMNVSAPVANLTLSGGSLDGAGTLTVSNSFNWTGGNLTTAAGTLALTGSCTSTISSANNRTLERIVTNAGTLTDTATGTITQQTADFTNSGTFNLQSDATWNTNVGSPTFINAASGIFIKSVATGQFNFGWAFTNNGTITINSGILNITGTFTSAANSAVTVRLAGTTVGTQFGQLSIPGGSALAGALNVTLAPAYEPNFGDAFLVVAIGGGAHTGAFTPNFPPLSGGKTFLSSYTAAGFQIAVQACGDANGDGQVNVADIFYMINNQFTGGPPPVNSFDVNGDLSTNVADIFYMINYLFVGGAAPICP